MAQGPSHFRDFRAMADWADDTGMKFLTGVQLIAPTPFANAARLGKGLATKANIESAGNGKLSSRR
jgi:hypothetical protein